jgi:hypothetical protein
LILRSEIYFIVHWFKTESNRGLLKASPTLQALVESLIQINRIRARLDCPRQSQRY